MVRWLEANGYDVSYFTGVDTDRRGAEICSSTRSSCRSGTTSTGRARSARTSRPRATPACTWRSSAATRSSGRRAGRTASTARARRYRTLVSYKETHANAKIDPSPDWTGTWRDPRFSPPADGGRPENALTGTIFTVNCCTDATSRSRRPRASCASGGTPRRHLVRRDSRHAAGRHARLRMGRGPRQRLPPGRAYAAVVRRRSTASAQLQDYGSTYGAGHGHARAHALPARERRAGLRRRHRPVVVGTGQQPRSRTAAADTALQQATVNLFADMGVQPGSLQPGLVPGARRAAPAPVITSPTAGATSPMARRTLTGTASDVGGPVPGCRGLDRRGSSWTPPPARRRGPTSGRPPWPGLATLRSRATDRPAIARRRRPASP